MHTTTSHVLSMFPTLIFRSWPERQQSFSLASLSRLLSTKAHQIPLHSPSLSIQAVDQSSSSLNHIRNVSHCLALINPRGCRRIGQLQSRSGQSSIFLHTHRQAINHHHRSLSSPQWLLDMSASTVTNALILIEPCRPGHRQLCPQLCRRCKGLANRGVLNS